MYKERSNNDKMNVKNCLTSSISKEMHIEIMRYHFSVIQRLKNMNHSGLKRDGEMNALVHCQQRL